MSYWRELARQGDVEKLDEAIKNVLSNQNDVVDKYMFGEYSPNDDHYGEGGLLRGALESENIDVLRYVMRMDPKVYVTAVYSTYPYDMVSMMEKPEIMCEQWRKGCFFSTQKLYNNLLTFVMVVLHLPTPKEDVDATELKIQKLCLLFRKSNVVFADTEWIMIWIRISIASQKKGTIHLASDTVDLDIVRDALDRYIQSKSFMVGQNRCLDSIRDNSKTKVAALLYAMKKSEIGTCELFTTSWMGLEACKSLIATYYR
jgi:hypothetical protein